MSKKILLIITGSVAAYKAIELARILQKKSFIVTCILTKAAQEFITQLQVSSVMQNKVYTDLFLDEDGAKMTHIRLSRDNDLIIVAPTSADFIAKMANGIADDLASTVILAADKKIMIAPAMNEKMWEKTATQNNLAKLAKADVSIISPISDVLACGELGVGKMREPAEISQKIEDFFINQNKLRGKKILITGGGTREMIDPVRFIGNDSSGKQAIALAKVLQEMGASVTLIAANINENIPLKNENIIRVKTADEMFSATKNELSNHQVFIGCAAVADYKIKNPSDKKIKKENTQNITLELEKNIDILDFVGHSSNRPALVIGFAAESENLVKNAQEKMRKKNCDFIIANDIESGAIFGASESRACLITKNSTQNLEKISKEALAYIVANAIVDGLRHC